MGPGVVQPRSGASVFRTLPDPRLKPSHWPPPFPLFSLPLPPDTPRRQLTHLNAPILNLSVAPGSLSRARPHRPATQLCSHHLNDPLRNPTASSWSTRDTHCPSPRGPALPCRTRRSVALQAAAAPWGPNAQSWASTTPHLSPAADPQPPARRFRSRLHAEYLAPTDGPTGRLRHTPPHRV